MSQANPFEPLPAAAVNSSPGEWPALPRHVAWVALAVGVIMGRKRIAGPCGGIANLGIEKECSICGGVREKCEEVNRDKSAQPEAQAYDATKR